MSKIILINGVRVSAAVSAALLALGACAPQAATDKPTASVQAASPYKLPASIISEDVTQQRHNIKVLNSTMTYLEGGSGEPVVFIHGNPTSSYLWRNVMPYVSTDNRAIAVDLIGMGGSDKPTIDYTFADHYRYFSAFIDALGLKDVSLVGHDWGAALAWEYARRNPNRVKRLAFMEGVLPPTFPRPTFESMGDEMGGMFRAFKDPAQGYKMVIEDNVFVEKVLPAFINRNLGEQAMAAYRTPFAKQSDRTPVLAWPREVPIEGQPQSTVDALNAIDAFMGQTRMPVLLAYAEPGVLIPPGSVHWYQDKIANLETSFVGQGLHFIQEDQPDAIGRSLADWLRRNPAR